MCPFQQSRDNLSLSTYVLSDDGTRVAAAEDKEFVLEATGDQASKLRDADRTITSLMRVNPAMWFPDTPNLSSLVLELKKNGPVMESVVQRIGFREIYKVDIGKEREQVQITGTQLIGRGVNRHDIDLEVATPSL